MTFDTIVNIAQDANTLSQVNQQKKQSAILTQLEGYGQLVLQKSLLAMINNSKSGGM